MRGVITISLALVLALSANADIAVIDYVSDPNNTEGQRWCDFLTSHGYSCHVFPAPGPDSSLFDYELVIDLSYEWRDPNHMLADFMRAGKGVITYAGAPCFLGPPEWVGANGYGNGGGDLVTVSAHPILGSIAPDTVIAECVDGYACGALWGELQSAMVLARWSSNGRIGLLCNEWGGGRSVYLTDPLSPDHPDFPEADGIILRAVRWALGRQWCNLVSDGTFLYELSDWPGGAEGSAQAGVEEKTAHANVLTLLRDEADASLGAAWVEQYLTLPDGRLTLEFDAAAWADACPTNLSTYAEVVYHPDTGAEQPVWISHFLAWEPQSPTGYEIPWSRVSVDLSAFAGTEGYLRFRIRHTDPQGIPVITYYFDNVLMVRELAGDLDSDGDVDLSDLAALLAVYGATWCQ
jgi:hypothetical protein